MALSLHRDAGPSFGGYSLLLWNGMNGQDSGCCHTNAHGEYNYYDVGCEDGKNEMTGEGNNS